MDVRELIGKLRRCPPGARVDTEGCDCYGEVGYVVLFEDPRLGTSVSLMRPDGPYHDRDRGRPDARRLAEV